MAHPVRVRTSAGWQDLALQGEPGPTGPAGTPGEKWFTGSGAPAGGLAGSIIGDWYLDSTTGDYYEKTGASAWTSRGNLRGPQGVQGIQGPVGVAEQWWSGAGAPAGITGVIGDWYLNTANGDVYEKTGASTWTVRANITGPAGATGSTGATGQAEAWYSGAGAPAGGTGAVGDWYLDTTAAGAGSGDVYEKTGASTWTLRANLKGPTGAAGSGAGVAAGGATNTILKKNSATDFDTGWTAKPTLDGIIVPTPGGTAKGRLVSLPGVPNWIGFTLNADYSSGWVLDDTALPGWFFKLDGRSTPSLQEFAVYRIPPGANPHTDESPVFRVNSTGAIVPGRMEVYGRLGAGPVVTPNEALEVSANVAGSRVNSANVKMSYSASPDAYANFIRNAFSGTASGHLMEFVLKQNSVEHTLLTLYADDRVVFGGQAIFGANIGVNLGGTTPVAAAHFASATITNGPLLALSYTDPNYRSVIKGTWSGSQVILNTTIYYMRTGIDGTERPVWTARGDGKLGIATQTNPARELDVIGDAIADSWIARPRSAAPTPTAGQLYYDSDDNTLYWYDGTGWVSGRGGTVPDATASVKGIVQLAGDLAGTAASPQLAAGAVVDADVNASAAIAESKLALASDAAAGTPSRRTLGAGALQAAAGNDSRFTDSRAPSGAASGDLSGTYPSPQLAAGVIVDADVNAGAAIAESKLALASDAAAGTASRRTLGTGATQAMPGNTTASGIPSSATGDVAATTVQAAIAELASEKVAADAVVTASARLVANRILAGDANETFKVRGDGRIDWGPGGATALDVNLYRSAVDVLKTDDEFQCVGDFRARAGTAAQVMITPQASLAGMTFGSAGDTNLYRAAANVLATDDTFDAPAFRIGGAAIATVLQARSERGAASGYATLDSGTKVPVAQIPDLSGTYQVLSAKGAASGYASLDSGSKVPAAQIPAKTLRTSHTFSVAGALVAGAVPGFFVPVVSGQTSAVVGVRAKIASGTSVVVQLTKNGSNVGSAVTVTPTVGNTALSTTLANDDELGITLSSPTGSPVGLSFSVYLEHAV